MKVKVGDTVYRECVVHGQPDYVQYGNVVSVHPNKAGGAVVWVDIQGPNGPAGEAPWGIGEIHATREKAVKAAKKRDAAFDALSPINPEEDKRPEPRPKPYVGVSKMNPKLLDMKVEVKDKEVFLDIDLDAVRSYLDSSGWKNKFRTRYCDIYEKHYPDCENDLPHQLHVPFTRELTDFVNVVGDIVYSLAKLDNMSQMLLLWNFSPLFRRAIEQFPGSKE